MDILESIAIIYTEPVNVYILELSRKCGFDRDSYFLIAALYQMIPRSLFPFCNEVFSHVPHT